MRRHTKHLAAALVLGFGLVACSDGAMTPMTPSSPGPSPATMSASGASYDLVRLPGEDGQAVELNNAGVVVGAATVEFQQWAVYWTVDEPGTVRGPATLGIPGEDIDAWAIGVNDAAEIIALEWPRGFIYDIATGELVELSRPEGAVGATPRSINGDGVVTGNAIYEEDGSTDVRPAVWTDPFDGSVAPTLLPLPADHAYTCALPVPFNDDGVVVAYSGTQDDTCRPLQWTLSADGSASEPELFGPSGFFGRHMDHAGRMAGQTGDFPDLQAVVLEPDGRTLALDPVAGDPQASAIGIDDPAQDRPFQVAGVSDI